MYTCCSGTVITCNKLDNIDVLSCVQVITCARTTMEAVPSCVCTLAITRHAAYVPTDVSSTKHSVKVSIHNVSCSCEHVTETETVSHW